MSILPLASPAASLRNKNAYIDGVIVAAIFALLATAQLFYFEDMISSVAVTQAFGDVGTKLFVATLVGMEIMALPYLLRLSMSPLFRMCSRAAGFIVGLSWLSIGLLGWDVSILGGIALPVSVSVVGGIVLLALCSWIGYRFRSK